jgi:endonuclease/exonuclease/phosphatase family metal-dependent hydrolase
VAGPPGSPSFTLATFNIYMGIDGWGRPFDVIGECRDLAADILILQESWAPDGGGPSTAGRIADALGYQVVHEEGLAHGQVFGPDPAADDRWGPKIGQRGDALLLDDERLGRRRHRGTRTAIRGAWGVAVLARIPFRDSTVIPLGKLRRDAARRVVISAVTDIDGREVSVLGTHMSHITHGSAAQYRRLNASLPDTSTAAVLAGDMNLWGPPVISFLPAWRRAVKGPTWPAQRPHSQLDHVLVTPGLSVVEARIVAHSGSDHRPVVVRLALT